MAVTANKNKIYSYDQTLNMLESLRNNFLMEPDVKKQVSKTLRASAEAYGIDITPYEEFLT